MNLSQKIKLMSCAIAFSAMAMSPTTSSANPLMKKSKSEEVTPLVVRVLPYGLLAMFLVYAEKPLLNHKKSNEFLKKYVAHIGTLFFGAMIFEQIKDDMKGVRKFLIKLMENASSKTIRVANAVSETVRA